MVFSITDAFKFSSISSDIDHLSKLIKSCNVEIRSLKRNLHFTKDFVPQNLDTLSKQQILSYITLCALYSQKNYLRSVELNKKKNRRLETRRLNKARNFIGKICDIYQNSSLCAKDKEILEKETSMFFSALLLYSRGNFDHFAETLKEIHRLIKLNPAKTKNYQSEILYFCKFLYENPEFFFDDVYEELEQNIRRLEDALKDENAPASPTHLQKSANEFQTQLAAYFQGIHSYMDNIRKATYKVMTWKEANYPLNQNPITKNADQPELLNVFVANSESNSKAFSKCASALIYTALQEEYIDREAAELLQLYSRPPANLYDSIATNQTDIVLQSFMEIFEALDKALEEANAAGDCESLVECLLYRRDEVLAYRNSIVCGDMGHCYWREELASDLRHLKDIGRSHSPLGRFFRNKISGESGIHSERLKNRKTHARDIEELYGKIESSLAEMADVLGDRCKKRAAKINFSLRYFRCFRVFYSAECFAKNNLDAEAIFLCQRVLSKIEEISKETLFDNGATSKIQLMALRERARKRLGYLMAKEYYSSTEIALKINVGSYFSERFLKKGSSEESYFSHCDAWDKLPQFELLYPKPILLDLALANFAENVEEKGYLDKR